MKLSQAIGIIMGANVGTTITSWLLSLTGIQGDNILLQLLKPSSFSPVLALIGIILVMFIKDSKKKDIGTIFIGFAILMYGMEAMSDAVAPLKDVPQFTQIFTMFTNPILGLIVGAVILNSCLWPALSPKHCGNTNLPYSWLYKPARKNGKKTIILDKLI